MKISTRVFLNRKYDLIRNLYSRSKSGYVAHTKHINTLTRPDILKIVSTKQNVVLLGCWSRACVIETAKACSEI